MSGVDPAPLTQEVPHGGWAAVVDDRLRLVHQPVSELGNESLDGKLVHRGIEGDAGHHVAEGHHLAQLRGIAGDPVMQAPLQVHRVPEECPVAVDRYGMRADHAHGRIGEMPQENVERTVVDHHVGTDHD